MSLQNIISAKNFIANALKINDQFRPTVGLVLGSGLFHFGDDLKKSSNARALSFGEIPHFARSGIVGHKGELIFGLLENRWPIVALSGRAHFYEGYEAQEVVLPVRVLKSLGINKLILTNACGAIADNFEPGQLMIIKDHLNLTGDSPLIGPNIDELGPRFVDMSAAYDKEFIAIAKEAARVAGIVAHEGVYAKVTGPCYETPAEVRMLKTLGADAVGMSTVFETIAARHMGMRVLGISCLTNKAAGLSNQEISHQEVMENNAKVALKFSIVLREIISKIA